ncbi:hypothetical protein B0H34DRAFT_713691 [Crassisporium funariophilum]|nr:hypothetical protein B0H34DRAFT_713691 [Crassisporium funariophilum]
MSSVEQPPRLCRHQKTLPDHASDPHVELAIVEAEVLRVADTLAGLIEKVHLLKRRINAIDSLIVRSLPPEIISEIFEFCIPSFVPNDDDTPTNISAPLRLGAVCSSWRRIAWATPVLWTSMTLHLFNAFKVPIQLKLLEEWLARSGNLPLSIRLSSSKEIQWGGTKLDEDIIKVVNLYSSRWHYLDLRLPSFCYASLPAPEESFPILHYLALKPQDGQGSRKNTVVIQNSPQLQHVTLSCLYIKSVHLQWHIITHIELESFYVDECLEVLRQAPQLLDVCLRKVLEGDDGHSLPESPLNLASLTHLSIYNENNTDVTMLLENILTPNLTHFHHTHTAGSQTVPVLAIPSLVKRSGCALKALTIDITAITTQELADLFRPMTALTSLTFKILRTDGKRPLTDDFLQLCDPQHISSDQTSCLMPQLERLDYTGPFSFSWDGLLRTLESRSGLLGQPIESYRSNGVSALQEVVIDVSEDRSSFEFPDDIASRFEKLKNHGVGVQLRRSSAKALF